MYTTVESWIAAFFFLFLFAFVTGFMSRKKHTTDRSILFVADSMLLFCMTAAIAVVIVEGTIRIATQDAWREGATYQRTTTQPLDNRWLLATGWYEVVEEDPFTRPSFSEDGYIVLAIRADGVGPLRVAFPESAWEVIPPEPRVKWSGGQWILENLPQPRPKAIRIAKSEGGHEHGAQIRVVDARF